MYDVSVCIQGGGVRNASEAWAAETKTDSAEWLKPAALIQNVIRPDVHWGFPLIARAGPAAPSRRIISACKERRHSLRLQEKIPK